MCVCVCQCTYLHTHMKIIILKLQVIPVRKTGKRPACPQNSPMPLVHIQQSQPTVTHFFHDTCPQLPCPHLCIGWIITAQSRPCHSEERRGEPKHRVTAEPEATPGLELQIESTWRPPSFSQLTTHTLSPNPTHLFITMSNPPTQVETFGWNRGHTSH